MQTQQVPPHAGATGLGIPLPQVGSPVDHTEDTGHKKKSVIGKVKDKAKKLKTKIKKPKSHDAAGDNKDVVHESSSPSSSEQDESGNDSPQQQLGNQTGLERDVVVHPGLKEEALEAIPDPHANNIGGVRERFGQLKLGDEPDATKMQNEVPSAPGQLSAGVTPYIAAHGLGQSTEVSEGIPVEEGKNVEGKDLIVTPTTDGKGIESMDYEQPSNVSKTSDNTAAWYTPTSAEDAPDANQQKPLKDRIFDGATTAKDTVAATAASGAGALGLRSADDSHNVSNKETDTTETSKTTLEQAKERVFGASETSEGEQPGVGENKPSVTDKAAGTVTGLKDTVAAKLGYGSNKDLTHERDFPLDSTINTGENKPSVTDKAAGTVIGLKDTVAAKLDYGSNKDLTHERDVSVDSTINTDENKPSVTDKAAGRVIGLKDTVAAKLGYGSNKDLTYGKDVPLDSTNVGESKPSVNDKAAGTVIGLKDTVASKLGYGSNKDLTHESDVSKDSTTNVSENEPSVTDKAAGMVTGLKDTVASKVGYGPSKDSTHEIGDSTINMQVDSQTPDQNKSVMQKIQERAGGATAAVTSKLGYGETQSPHGDNSSLAAVADEANPGNNKSYTEFAKDAAYGAKNAVAEKLGYGGASAKEDVTSATNYDDKSYLQKAQETATVARDAVASKLGYVNSETPPTTNYGVYGEEKNVPSDTAALFHPREEDKALSELVTDKMSTGAATVKDTLLKPFASKSGPPTPTTTPPPSSAAAIEADPVYSTVPGTKPDVLQVEKPGFVGKVTEAVSSLLGSPVYGKKRTDEAAGKAIEDPQARAAAGGV